MFSANGTHKIRLVGGPNNMTGRLEIFHNNRWGTVCDDSFDDVDARVACFSLGHGFVAFCIIIIIVITTTIFIVLSSWQSHCKNSLGSRNEYGTKLSCARPWADLWAGKHLGM